MSFERLSLSTLNLPASIIGVSCLLVTCLLFTLFCLCGISCLFVWIEFSCLAVSDIMVLCCGYETYLLVEFLRKVEMLVHLQLYLS